MEMERGWKAGGLHLCQNLCHLFPVLVWLLGRCGKVPVTLSATSAQGWPGKSQAAAGMGGEGASNSGRATRQ